MFWSGCSGPTRPESFGPTSPTGSRVGKPAPIRSFRLSWLLWRRLQVEPHLPGQVGPGLAEKHTFVIPALPGGVERGEQPRLHLLGVVQLPEGQRRSEPPHRGMNIHDRGG